MGFEISAHTADQDVKEDVRLKSLESCLDPAITTCICMCVIILLPRCFFFQLAAFGALIYVILCDI